MKIIALAVAGLVSGAAFAQTNVTVYGVVDAAYTYSKAGDQKYTGIQSGQWNGSRVGFRGEEALGNGLKAIFTYEFGLNSDDQATSGTGISQTRQSFVGLAGNFGTVSLGRQYAPSGIYYGDTTNNGITSVYPSNLFQPQFATLQTGGGSRWNNSVAYQSPIFSGFDFRFVYGFGENTREDTSDAFTDGSRYGIGARYANGPLYLTAIYQQILKNDGSVGVDANKAWGLGGSYDFKVVKLYANYSAEKDDTQVSDSNDSKKKTWTVGVGVPVSTQGTVLVEYAGYKRDYSSSSSNSDGKADGWGIGYTHDLSKRTRLYTTLSRINNKDNLALGYNVSSTEDANTNFQVGIRHFF